MSEDRTYSWSEIRVINEKIGNLRGDAGPGTKVYVNKLTTITRCPVCGDPVNDGLSYTVPDLFARRDFTCGAAFVTANAQIVVATPCPAGSQVQADLLNREVEEPVQTVEKRNIGERNGDHH